MAKCFSDGSRSGVLQQACVLLADSSEALVQKAISGEASAAEFFDVTWDSAARLFYSVVAEGDLYYKTHDREAVATPRQVKIALMQQGFETRRALQRVVNALPPGGVGVDAFHALVRDIKTRIARALPVPDAGEAARVSVVKYAPDSLQSATKADALAPAPGHVLWISADDAGAPAVLQLAVGLELHPVVTENLLHLSSARQSLRSYGSSSGQRELTALFIRAFRATRGDSPLDAEAAMLSLIFAASTDGDVVLTVQSAWQPCRDLAPRADAPSGQRRPEPARTAAGVELADRERHFDGVRQQLCDPTAALRHSDGPSLVQALLGALVAPVRVLLDRARALLRACGSELRAEKPPTPHRAKALRASVAGTASHLAMLEREMRANMREYQGAVARLAVCRDVATALEDLVGALEECQAEARKFSEDLKALRSNRVKKSIYRLTVVVTVQWAWTTLIGIYSMNFLDRANQYDVPLLGALSTDRGWLIFWVLGVVLMLMVWKLTSLVVKGW